MAKEDAHDECMAKDGTYPMSMTCKTNDFSLFAWAMCRMGEMFWHRNQKFRVTIDYDPESERVHIIREDFGQMSD